MSWLRSFPVASLMAAALILAGATAEQNPPAPQSAPPPPVPKTPQVDVDAKKILDETVEGLDRKKLSWIETTLWLQMDAQGQTMQADGLYYAGPNNRSNMDLKVRVGDAQGRLEFVCDGIHFQEAMTLGESKRKVKKADLAKEIQAAQSRSTTAMGQEALLEKIGFAGVLPLMKSLQKRMIFTRKERTQWNGKEVVLLSASWSAESTKEVTNDLRQWQPLVPRSCQVYLGMTDARAAGKISWPFRIEWWGPTYSSKEDKLLLQMEFRDPKLNVEMSAERQSQLFKLDPDQAATP